MNNEERGNSILDRMFSDKILIMTDVDMVCRGFAPHEMANCIANLMNHLMARQNEKDLESFRRDMYQVVDTFVDFHKGETEDEETKEAKSVFNQGVEA